MKIIGLMSGTSLDGVDLAYCDFSTLSDGSLSHSLLAAETYPYPREWEQRLRGLHDSPAVEYALADVQLGHYLGTLVNRFRAAHPGPVDLVASHGHTIFHQPHIGFTAQIGDGNAIAAETNLPVAFDFRRLDVALQGQGAPLVPIGDALLFGDYDACLNLGGFSNISFQGDANQRVAFDVSPCNMALNSLALRLGMPFDPDGNLARGGKLSSPLLAALNALPYYGQPAPKSLGKEWYLSQFEPLLDASLPAADLLRTVTEHIAIQISSLLNDKQLRTLLVTGGGAKNSFLIERIQHLAPKCLTTIPPSDTIDYKEAIIFALLGYLRVSGKHNTWSSVTGAMRDSAGGLLVDPR